MVEIADLPHALAALNGLSAVFLAAGFVLIRRGERRAHKAVMVSALAVSAAFLVVYVVYHAGGGQGAFAGEGMVRPIYFVLLVGHILLAVAIVPLVPFTLLQAFAGHFERHRRWARWTLPVWLYVGVSGVAVYVMRVHLYPAAGG